MKKIVLLIISLIIVGCSPAKLETTICTKTIEKPVKIDRSLTLYHNDNLITNIDSEDKMFFSKKFTQEMFDKLMDDMKDRHLESDHIVFEEEVSEEYAIITIKLSDIENATGPELMLMGIEKDDVEFMSGLTETIRYNEKAGFTCKPEK